MTIPSPDPAPERPPYTDPVSFTAPVPGQNSFSGPASLPAMAATNMPATPTEHFMIPGAGTVRVASMGRRLGAHVLDYAIFIVVGVAYIGLFVGGSSDPSGYALLGFYALLIFGPLLYESLMLTFVGATVGKKAMGIKVVGATSGTNPSFGSSLGRALVPRFLSFFSCGVLEPVWALSPFFDGTRRKQGWHDKVANTFVISARDEAETTNSVLTG